MPTLLTAALALSSLAPQGAFAAEPSAPPKDAKAAPVASSTKATPAPQTKAPEAAVAKPVSGEADKSAAPKAEVTSTTSEAAPTAAEPTKEQSEAAKLSFEAGTKAFDEKDYTTAATEFKKAYEQIPSPHAEYWIARALDAGDAQNQNAAEVVAAYSKFLSNPGAQHAGAERVAEAQARVVELKKLLPAQIKLITVPAGASVTIDGKLHEGSTPFEVALPSGAHKFEVALEGYESTMVEMDLQGGTAVEQEVTLSKQAPPPAAAEPVVVEPTAKKSLVPAAVTLGLGGAGLISGTLFGIMALGAKKDFNDDPTTANADTAERNALIADMSFGIALTLGITGVVLLTAEDEEAAAETAQNRRILVAPYADKKGGGLAGFFRF